MRNVNLNAYSLHMVPWDGPFLYNPTGGTRGATPAGVVSTLATKQCFFPSRMLEATLATPDFLDKRLS